MVKYWIGSALIAGCLTMATAAQAQCKDGPAIPGPLTGENAPSGPCDDLGIRADRPNAFTIGDTPRCCDVAWFSAEWLYWWIADPHLPAPLVTTSSAPTGTGALGAPGTNILLQGEMRYNPLNGARLTAGVWFNSNHSLGMEASGFGMEQIVAAFDLQSDRTGHPLVAIPFRNGATGPEASFILAQPATGMGGLATGGVNVSNSTRLWGGEANLVSDVTVCGIPLTLLVGGRYLQEEDTFILLGQRNTPGNNQTLTFEDHFNTRNTFAGGQLGVRTTYDWGRFWVGVQVKVALGDNHQAISINGGNTISLPGQLTRSTPGGLFAVNSNSGTRSTDIFGVIPDGQLKFGFRLTDYWTFTAGYNYLWWNRTYRAADQLDRRVDMAQILNGNGGVQGTVPVLAPVERAFWAHGISVGLELSY